MTEVIVGVRRVELQTHVDERGDLTEVFRESWFDSFDLVQWNYVRSAANVLRGVHCHVDHSDMLVLAEGHMVLGLHDLRPGSASAGRSTLTELTSTSGALLIPPGVAHGFYFGERSVLLYAVTHMWNMDDELGCRWDDPELGLRWPCVSPRLSARDVTAGSLRDLRVAVQAGLASTVTESGPSAGASSSF